MGEDSTARVLVAEKPEVPQVVTELLGTVLEGRYRVEEVLAIGGMSFVFRGHHLRLRRDVAIKVMDPNLGPGASTRFLREAESAARLDHPNCITVHDFGSTATDLSFMVMPLLVGETLRRRAPGRWEPARAVRLVMEVLRGLDHAHAHGVIHRDLKPENIWMCAETDGSRVAKIVDFGLAKVIRGAEADTTTTMTGLMAGTPAYMSPEQALGLSVDERADLYSVGMMLYELLAGDLPFGAEDGVAVLRMQLHDELPALPDSVPPVLAGIVMRMTEKERDNRPASARAVLDDLESFLRGDGHTLLAPSVRRATPDFSEPSLALLDAASSHSGSSRSGSRSIRGDVTIYDDDTDELPRRSGRVWLWLAAAVATVSAATVVAIASTQPSVRLVAVEPSVIAAAPQVLTAQVIEGEAPICDAGVASVESAECAAQAGLTAAHAREAVAPLARESAASPAEPPAAQKTKPRRDATARAKANRAAARKREAAATPAPKPRKSTIPKLDDDLRRPG